MASKTFDDLLTKTRAMYEKKNHDYAQNDDPFSNFKRAAILASWFNDEHDKVFATMIGIKLARLAELRNGKIPKNESIEDTMLDEFVYSGIWYSFVRDHA